MSTFTKCDESVNDLARSLIKRNHLEAYAAEVKVECLFAYAAVDKNGEPRGPAIKHAGYPALAKIRALPLKDRAAGRADCECLIDGRAWEEMHDDRRAALMDHELTHVEVLRDKDGAIKSDDIGRPKVRMKPHDWNLGGFASIAKRHGEDSFEVSEMQAVQVAYGQLLFGFMADEDRVEKIMHKVAEKVNAGAMDSDQVKFKVKVGKFLEEEGVAVV